MEEHMEKWSSEQGERAPAPRQPSRDASDRGPDQIAEAQGLEAFRWHDEPGRDDEGGVGGVGDGGPAAGLQDQDGEPINPNRGGAFRAPSRRRRGGRLRARGSRGGRGRVGGSSLAVGPQDQEGEPSLPNPDDDDVGGAGPASGPRDQEGEPPIRGGRSGRRGRGGRGGVQPSPTQSLVSSHPTSGESLRIIHQGHGSLTTTLPMSRVTMGEFLSIWRHQNRGRLPPTFITTHTLDRTVNRYKNRRWAIGSRPKLLPQASEPDPEPQSRPSLAPAAKARRKKKNRTRFERRERRKAESRVESRVEELSEGEGEDEGEGPASAEPPPVPRIVLPPVPPGGPRFDRPPQYRPRDPNELSFFPQGPPAPQALPITCANCGKAGHEVVQCPGPVDADGFVVGCPVHNTRDHSFDQCWVEGDWASDDPRYFEYLVQRRAWLPPLRTSVSWVAFAFNGDEVYVTLGYPLTRGYSRTISQQVIDKYDFGIASLTGPQLGVDSMTSSPFLVRLNRERLMVTEKGPEPAAPMSSDDNDVPMQGADYDAPSDGVNPPDDDASSAECDDAE
ncbi:uncharacterized protein F4807DRAFT_469344 [Annulohypoxylon truncatum]|uniref:uncharacterized protein n=1 Tax=Annulohypoxylon truncatum TaxID=327061 RepID=UPI00200733E2|nr:uncharacterized protein F4807DRAFT_469344 [Annulohypoxylon truncatum]KAI1207555.1 hypothetical protein F4807DRAFT_469344 [Annulohypoxylon truncatum]